MRVDPLPPRSRLPRRTLVSITLLAASASLAAAWLVVLRPAAEGRSQNTGPADSAPERPATLGEHVPELMIEGLDGPDISTAELRGTPVLINFWASTCAPCVKEMPLLQAAYLDLGGTVAFIGVDVSEQVEPGIAMVRQTGVAYPQGRDPRGTVLGRFNGTQLPYTVLIDAAGTVVSFRDRAIRTRAELDELLGPLK